MPGALLLPESWAGYSFLMPEGNITAISVEYEDLVKTTEKQDEFLTHIAKGTVYTFALKGTKTNGAIEGGEVKVVDIDKMQGQLVADDVVDIRKVEDNRLIGEAPELVRHFMEIRGVGIIDVSTMYGAGAIMRSKTINLIIHLEMWQADKEYDRLGLSDNYTEILGVKVPSLLLPIHPGRNLAVVLEVAARNLRLKQMGYNAANELTRRHMERFQHNIED